MKRNERSVFGTSFLKCKAALRRWPQKLRSAVLGHGLTAGTVKMIYDGPGESEMDGKE